MKLNTLLLSLICLCVFYTCTNKKEKSFCQQIQNQYWIDLDTTVIFLSYHKQDTIFIFSSELGFFRQYQRCENNILQTDYKKGTTDSHNIQRLDLNQDTLTLEVVTNDFVSKGFISKMKRITKTEADTILAPYLHISIKNNITIESPR